MLHEKSMDHLEVGEVANKISISKIEEIGPINYAKVVILGDRGVGKTALIKVRKNIDGMYLFYNMMKNLWYQ